MTPARSEELRGVVQRIRERLAEQAITDSSVVNQLVNDVTLLAGIVDQLLTEVVR